MTLDRGNGIAMWRQIEAALVEDIRQQHFAPGERLPNETALGDRFGVNRHTVRRALAVLERSGLVRVEQGRGTFVQDFAIDYTIGRRTRFSENLRKAGLASSIEVLRWAEIPAQSTVADALELARGARVIQVVTVGRAEGRPIDVAHSHFAAERFSGIADRIRDAASVTKALAHYDITDYTRGRSRVTAKLPDDETARLLMQPKTHPVLEVEAINLGSDGRPIQYSVTRFAGDWVQLVFEPDQ